MPRLLFPLLLSLYLQTMYGVPLVSSYDLGSHPIVGTVSQAISVPLGSSLNGQTVNASLSYNIDFTLSGSTCSVAGSTCSLNVSFTPKYAGLRKDGMRLTDGAGNLVATAYLHGSGLGPQMVFRPGVISVKERSYSHEFGSLVLDPTGRAYYTSYFGVYSISLGQPTSSLYAGTGNSYSGSTVDGVLATNALVDPRSLALDGAGNLFIGVPGAVRRVDRVTGIISTVASGGAYINTCGAALGPLQNAVANAAATDSSGNIYVLTDNRYVCKIDAATGNISRLAGNGIDQFSGDGGLAINAGMNNSYSIAVDSTGAVFVLQDVRVRRVDPVSQTIQTFAGGGADGSSVNDVPATSAQFLDIHGMALDGLGNLYVASQAEGIIRKIDSATNLIHTIAGSKQGSAFKDGLAANRVFLIADSLTTDSAGNLFQGVPGTLFEIVSESTSINFARLGSTGASETLALENLGNAPLQLQSETVSGPFSISQPSGASDCYFPAMVDAGKVCLVNVDYEPLLGDAPGNLTVVSNSRNNLSSTQTASLQRGYPVATIEPTSINFGLNLLGATIMSFPVSLINTGNVPLVFQSIGIAGANASEFAVDAQTCFVTSSIAPLARCEIDVAFTPTLEGTKSASLVIMDNARDSPQSVPITALIRTPGILSISPNPILFNFVPVGQSSSKTITLRNVGESTLYINNLSISAPFSLSPASSLSTSLDPGVSMPMTITFKPTEGKVAFGTFTGFINFNQIANGNVVPVIGTTNPPTDSAVDDTGSEIIYSGTWGHNIAAGRVDGTQSFSNTLGDSASFSFIGTQVAYVYDAQANLGHVQISIDNTVVTPDLDEYSATPALQKRMIYSGLADGNHTIKVTILGSRDSSSSNSYGIVDAFLVGPSVTAYDDVDPGVTYTGTWGHNTAPQRYQGTQSFSKQVGDQASFAFTGTQVTYVYEAQNNLGHARISIDGIVVTPDLDEYSANLLTQQQQVYSNLSSGTHTITVTVLGNRDLVSSNSYVIVDAFLVGSTSGGTYDDLDPSIRYSGNWGQNTATDRYQGTQSYSRTASDTANFTFYGTQVAYVYAAQSNLGHAQISIDGSIVTADLDEYSSSSKPQQRIAYSGLSDGQHTIQVSVLGTKDSASSNTYVIVDAFVVGVPGSGIYDDADPYLQYTGNWGHNEINQRYAGTQSFSNISGDLVTFTFTGTQVAYLYEMRPNCGHVQVSIDGAVVTSDLDEYSSQLYGPFPLRMIYRGLAAGTHIITVAILGRHDSASTNSYGIVDGFIVGPDASIYDDLDPAMTYSGTWTSTAASGRYMGTQTFSNEQGDYVDFSFTGTQITYIYERQPNMGQAVVSIDERVVSALLDEYSPTHLGPQRTTYSGLAAGPHTIRVLVQGGSNVASSDRYIIIDGFEVTP